jgi:hypothetical protein
MAVMIDKETKEAAPVTAFLNMPTSWPRTGQGQRRGPRQVALGDRHGAGADAQLRSLPGAHALQDHRHDEEDGQDLRRHRQELRQVKGDRTMDDIKKRRQDRWNFLFIAGMWFQDLFNYDFRRTEQCIIPYATQEGEISFCAYNTGVGWRNIIEKMHMTATLTKWYEEHGRHEIFAGGKKVTCWARSRSKAWFVWTRLPQQQSRSKPASLSQATDSLLPGSLHHKGRSHSERPLCFKNSSRNRNSTHRCVSLNLH